MPSCRTFRLGSFVAAVGIAAQCAFAQCSAVVLPGTGINGVGSGYQVGAVLATTHWDPDGTGPLGPRLVFGGTFTQAGDQFTTNIAAWDPATGTWHAFGSGLPGAYVRALAVLPNGDLVAAGNLDPLVGTTAEHIARWNGTAWTSLGGGCDATVRALHVTPAGTLIAGGDFTTAGTVAANRVAGWSGTAWQPLGSGVASYVMMLGTDPNGDLVVGGGFQTAGGIAANRIARWNGVAWQPFGSGLADVPVCMTTLGAELIVAGDQVGPGGLGRIARWNGSTWTTVGGSGPDNTVHALLPEANGDLVVGGDFSNCNGAPCIGLARWNGSAWSTEASPSPGSVRDLRRLASGELVVAGNFPSSGIPVSGIGRWNGTQWSALTQGAPPDATVLRVVPLSDGGYLAAGRFNAIGGIAANGIARWTGTTWTPLGSGCSNAVFDAVELPNGDLVVAGQFTHAGGVNSPTIARWDGSAWHAFPNPGFAVGTRLIRMTNGDLVIVLDPLALLRRFDGNTWSTIATLSGLQPVRLTELPNGDLVLAGSFTNVNGVAANNIARWDGATWHSLGAGSSRPVSALHAMPDGSLVVGDMVYSSPAGVSRWDGVTWTSLGSPFTLATYALATTVSGDLLAAGTDWSGAPVHHPIQRWNGSAWTPFLAIASTPASQHWIADLARIDNGDLVAGGWFPSLDGVVSQAVARITTTCPANVVAAGSGCGSATLTADHPWTGTTWTSRTSNLPPAALVFAAFGFAPATLPLANVFTTALPGCTLHVTPDHVTMTLAANGVVTTSFVLPANPTLTGITFHHQMVPLALDATLAVTATNALQMTVGTW